MPSGVDMDFNSNETSYDDHRISTGVPQLLKDFQSGEKFPHDALMDQFENSGVDFTKGCFVGQEVVSRMQHRGTARNRFVLASSESALEANSPLCVGDKVVGTVASTCDGMGLALVRVDRVSSAMADGETIKAEGKPVQLKIPEFVSFGWQA